MTKQMVKNAFLAALALSLIACQRLEPTTGPIGTIPEPDSTNSFQLCSDGTLNCYVDVENTTTTVFLNDLNFAQSYLECMQQCLPTQTCSNSAYLNITSQSQLAATASNCPAAFQVCDSQCSVSSAGTIADSDQISLPAEPRMAVVVEIRSCFDVNTNEGHEIHFQGPNVNYKTMMEGTRNVRDGGFLDFGTDHVRLGYEVGRNPGCSSALQGKVNVKFKPVVQNSVVLGNSSFNVIPFASGTVIEKNYKSPHSASFGIPQDLRDQIDMSEVTWVAKSFGASANPGVTIGNGFSFYNNDIPYGLSIVHVYPYFTNPFISTGQDTEQTITMVMFAKQPTN